MVHWLICQIEMPFFHLWRLFGREERGFLFGLWTVFVDLRHWNYKRQNPELFP